MRGQKGDFQLPLSDQLERRLTSAAKENRRSLADEINTRLLDSFNPAGIPKHVFKKVKEYQGNMPPGSDPSFDGTLAFLVNAGLRSMARHDSDYETRISLAELRLDVCLKRFAQGKDVAAELPGLTAEELLEAMDEIFEELEGVTDVLLEEGQRKLSSEREMVALKRRMRQILEDIAGSLETGETSVDEQ